MTAILVLLFLAIAIGFGLWRQMKAVRIPKEVARRAMIPPQWGGTFIHPGHSWVEVIEPQLVTVGTDAFTKSVFGSVENLTVPEKGTLIQQGGEAWMLKRGIRQLVQASPISGRIVEINQELIDNPSLLTQNNAMKNWILKVNPIRLKTELQNLFHGSMALQWNQVVKDQLVASLSMAEFPVLQEGGEIKPDLGDELTSQQWEKVSSEFF